LGVDPPGTSDAWLFLDAAGIDQTVKISLFNGNGRVAPQAMKLNDGSIVVVGGALTSQDAPTAEVLRVGTGVAFKAEVLGGPPIGEAREDAAFAVLPTNQGVYCGGFDSAKKDSTACEIYFGP